MSLVLDPATEARLQRHLERGTYSAPTEVLNRALDLLEAEDATTQAMNDWLLRNKETINRDLDRSFAQDERGEGYSPQESRELLDHHRAGRAR